MAGFHKVNNHNSNTYHTLCSLDCERYKMVVSLVARATAKCLRILNEKDLGEKFPEVSDSVAALDVQDAVIDDEIVARAKKGGVVFPVAAGARHGRRG
jgi:hypothetical protein